MSDGRIRTAIITQLLQKLLNIHSLDVCQFPPTEMIRQDLKGIAVVLLGSGRDIVLMMLQPGCSELIKARIFGNQQTGCPLALELFSLFDCFLPGLTRKCTDVTLTIRFVPDHDLADPNTIFSLEKSTFSICPFICHF